MASGKYSSFIKSFLLSCGAPHPHGPICSTQDRVEASVRASCHQIDLRDVSGPLATSTANLDSPGSFNPFFTGGKMI